MDAYACQSVLHTDTIKRVFVVVHCECVWRKDDVVMNLLLVAFYFLLRAFFRVFIYLSFRAFRNDYGIADILSLLKLEMYAVEVQQSEILKRVALTTKV